MSKVRLIIFSALALIFLPAIALAHSDINAPTITLDEFIAQIQYDEKEQFWAYKDDYFPHVLLEIRYNNYGVLFRGRGENDSTRIHILLNSPFRQSYGKSFPISLKNHEIAVDQRMARVDSFKLFLEPAPSSIPKTTFPQAIELYEKYLKSMQNPVVVKAHPTTVSTRRYLDESNRFYYLDIHFTEIVPERFKANPAAMSLGFLTAQEPCINCWKEINIDGDTNNDPKDNGKLRVNWYQDPENKNYYGMVIWLGDGKGSFRAIVKAWDIYKDEAGGKLNFGKIFMALLINRNSEAMRNDLWYIGAKGERLKTKRDYGQDGNTTAVTYTFEGDNGFVSKTFILP